ncbi:MAG TPA: triose-phosphate isomerase [Gammaproteobacteria bacterium]|nr:triose-phosphate isomerase [Gammaproteobacteria bacterium]
MTRAARRPLVAGNWKMNGSLAASEKLVSALRAGVPAKAAADMLLCPAYPYLAPVAGWVRGTAIAVGAQDVSVRMGVGAFTGEVSGAMLADVGCSYAIVGHSERRTLFGDTDAKVAAKFEAAQAAGLVPILCVGETLEERETNSTEAVVGRQVAAVLGAAGVAAFASAVVAYEPVWAIGTGKTATPEQAQEVHAMIRAMIAARDGTIAAGLAILYGGSVKAANAAELFAMDDIDGGLVGGASLEAAEFLGIFRAACSQAERT